MDLICQKKQRMSSRSQQSKNHRYSKPKQSPVDIPKNTWFGRKIWDVFQKDENEKRFAVVKRVFAEGKTVEMEDKDANFDFFFVLKAVGF